MKSKLCEFISEMQIIANANDIIIEAQHLDVLDYYHRANQSPMEAFKNYSKFRVRIYALEGKQFPEVTIKC